MLYLAYLLSACLEDLHVRTLNADQIYVEVSLNLKKQVLNDIKHRKLSTHCITVARTYKTFNIWPNKLLRYLIFKLKQKGCQVIGFRTMY